MGDIVVTQDPVKPGAQFFHRYRGDAATAPAYVGPLAHDDAGMCRAADALGLTAFCRGQQLYVRIGRRWLRMEEPCRPGA